MFKDLPCRTMNNLAPIVKNNMLVLYWMTIGAIKTTEMHFVDRTSIFFHIQPGGISSNQWAVNCKRE